MTKIKTIKDLHKFMANTDWTSLEFSKEDEDKFGGYCLSPKLDHDEKYRFDTKGSMFAKRNVKTGDYDYTIKALKCNMNTYEHRNEKRAHLSYDQREKYISNENHTVGVYQLHGNKCRYHDNKYSDMYIFVNDWTKDIIYINYRLDDVWWNDFFRKHFDESIENNFDEINTEKNFTFLVHKVLFKKINVTDLTFQKAIGQVKNIAKEHGYTTEDYSCGYGHVPCVFTDSTESFVDDEDITQEMAQDGKWHTRGTTTDEWD